MHDLLILEYLIDPDRRTFWVYILTSIAIGIVYMASNRRYKRVNFNLKLWLHPSAKLDYYYFVLSYFIKIMLIIPIVISAKTVALWVNRQLYYGFGYNHIAHLSYETVVILYTIALFVVSDFSRYWIHRFLHTIPILWEFHKVHHSAKVLNPLTFYRVHPVENILFGFRYSLCIGLVTGIFIYFFGSKIGVHEVLGANIFVFIFSLLGSNLRHSHIPFAYFKPLEKWFISPKQHQIHHSNKYFDKNYGSYLAIWDRVFGSLKLSCEVKVLKFGLKKEQMKNYASLTNIIVHPFINILRRRN